MRRQIINRGKRFIRGASGPYAHRIRGNTYVNTFGRRSNGNLWTDNPDSVGAGWTDNGDGSYTCDGTDGTAVEQSAAIEDGATYKVNFEITGYVGGSVVFYLGGPTNFGVSSDASGNGTFSRTVLVTNPGSAPNLISMDSNSFNGTVSNIEVLKQ